MHYPYISATMVLILVLVEYTLRDYYELLADMNGLVLILVLVEYTLRARTIALPNTKDMS